MASAAGGKLEKLEGELDVASKVLVILASWNSPVPSYCVFIFF